jgi:hypothetical protein
MAGHLYILYVICHILYIIYGIFNITVLDQRNHFDLHITMYVMKWQLAANPSLI